MDKLFAVAGVSRREGVLTTRVAKDMNRTKVLEKIHTDVRLIELPNQMTKLDAVTYLLTHEQYQDEETQAAIKARIAKIVGKPKKSEKASEGDAVATHSATNSTAETVADIVADIVASSQDIAPAKTPAKRPSRSKAAVAKTETVEG